MGLPLPPNTTFDLYRPPNAPRSAPDSAGNACVLRPDYSAGLEHGEGDPIGVRYHAILLCDLNVDVRDTYDAGTLVGNADLLYIPDQNGSAWIVAFVERVGWNSGHDHKRVYLRRVNAPWPTSGGI
jgi:hypothetical protein